MMEKDLSTFLHDGLDSLEHTSSVEIFYTQFETIKDLLSSSQPWIPEAYFTDRFIYGLRQDVQRYVINFRPSTVLDAFHLSCIYEYHVSEQQYECVDVVDAYKFMVEEVNDGQVYEENIDCEPCDSDSIMPETTVCERVPGVIHVHQENAGDEEESIAVLQDSECVVSPTQASELDVIRPITDWNPHPASDIIFFDVATDIQAPESGFSPQHSEKKTNSEINVTPFTPRLTEPLGVGNALGYFFRKPNKCTYDLTLSITVIVACQFHNLDPPWALHEDLLLLLYDTNPINVLMTLFQKQDLFAYAPDSFSPWAHGLHALEVESFVVSKLMLPVRGSATKNAPLQMVVETQAVQAASSFLQKVGQDIAFSSTLCLAGSSMGHHLPVVLLHVIHHIVVSVAITTITGCFLYDSSSTRSAASVVSRCRLEIYAFGLCMILVVEMPSREQNNVTP